MNNKKWVVGILAGVVVFVGTCSYIKAEGEQITVCIRKSGVVYVVGETFKREECKKGDSLLSWNVAGPQGQKGDKGDKGDPGSGHQFHLYDGNGQDLGIFIDYYYTLDPSTKTLFVFNQATIGTAQFLPTQATIYFDNPDCTGNAFYSITSPGTVTRSVTAYTDDGSIFSPIYKPLFSTIESRTALSKFSTPTIPCINSNEPISNAVMLEQITLPFTSPLAWPLEVR